MTVEMVEEIPGVKEVDDDTSSGGGGIGGGSTMLVVVIAIVVVVVVVVVVVAGRQDHRGTCDDGRPCHLRCSDEI